MISDFQLDIDVLEEEDSKVETTHGVTCSHIYPFNVQPAMTNGYCVSDDHPIAEASSDDGYCFISSLLKRIKWLFHVDKRKNLLIV